MSVTVDRDTLLSKKRNLENFSDYVEEMIDMHFACSEKECLAAHTLYTDDVVKRLETIEAIQLERNMYDDVWVKHRADVEKHFYTKYKIFGRAYPSLLCSLVVKNI